MSSDRVKWCGDEVDACMIILQWLYYLFAHFLIFEMQRGEGCIRRRAGCAIPKIWGLIMIMIGVGEGDGWFRLIVGKNGSLLQLLRGRKEDLCLLTSVASTAQHFRYSIPLLNCERRRDKCLGWHQFELPLRGDVQV